MFTFIWTERRNFMDESHIIKLGLNFKIFIMPSQNPTPDFTDLTEKQLKFATWYVAHKILLRKILISFLIALSVIFWGYGLYGLVNYYFIEGPKFSRMLKELSRPADFEEARARFQPKNLETGTVLVLSAGKERYDLLVKVLNHNSNWYAEFDYNFVVDGKSISQKNGFVLPGEEKFLLALGVEAKTKPRQVILEIQNLRWQKIDAHKIPNYISWRDEHINFIFQDVKFLPAVVQDKITISRVSFQVKNSSPYSFWDVGFIILLYRGSSIVAANYITLGEFLSGQNRSVEVSWFEPLPSITQVKVTSEVNIFDQRVYMPVE